MEFDPYSPELRSDPYPVYRELRDRYPVFLNEQRRFWVLSRFADVDAALHDTETYSSASGVTLETPDVTVPMLVTMDPPTHTHFRSLVSKAFTPRRIAALEEHIREIARQLIADVARRGACDLIRDFAGPLPTIVIAELLGVPPADRAMFRAWTDRLIVSRPESSLASDGLAAALELFGYFNGILAERRSTPRDDLLTGLLAAEAGGSCLANEELLGFCLLLLVAGNETTTNLIGNGTLALAHHEDQRARLVADPSLLASAIEEMLRFDSPAQGVVRTLRRSPELHGLRMREGDKVLLLIGAANRDERKFPEPDRLDIARKPNGHVAFGVGDHFCLGASLARLEARVAFGEFLERIPRFEVTTDQLEYVASVNLRGLKALPITFYNRGSSMSSHEDTGGKSMEPYTPRNRPIVDCDGHILEPMDIWERYLPTGIAEQAQAHLRWDDRPVLGTTVTIEQRSIPGFHSAGLAGVPLDQARGRGWRDAIPGAFDPVARLTDMDAEGIDKAIIYPTVCTMILGVRSPGLAAHMCHAYNDMLAEYCKANPARLFGAALVPLQDPTLAATEVQRAIEQLQFRAVLHRPNFFDEGKSRMVSDPAFEALYAQCQDLDVPIAFHPSPTPDLDGTFRTLYSSEGGGLLGDLACFPMDNMLCLAALVFHGTLDRFPRLKVVLLESNGSWMPMWLERMDTRFRLARSMFPGLKTRPSEIFARQVYIAIEGDEQAAARVYDLLGEDHIMWSSDYPHYDCVFPGAVRVLEETISRLSHEVQQKIAGQTAERVFSLG